MNHTFFRYFYSMALALAILVVAPVVVADGHTKKATILDILLKTDGAQALVASALLVDDSGVLGELVLAELLGDPHAEAVLLAPSNAAFEKLLGLDAGFLNGKSIKQIKRALPDVLSKLGLSELDVANILLKHVSLQKRANLRTASDNALLKRGHIEVAADENYPVSVGASGVQVNYETTIIKANILARNGVIHFIDTVIVNADD